MDDLYCLGDLRTDSLVDLLKASFSLEDYEKMIEIADRLYASAKEIYYHQQDAMKSGKRYVYGERKRHLIYYYGFANLAKGIALQNMERFEEAKLCIDQYKDLSFLDDGTEEAAKEIEIYKMFAKANIYAVNILSGKIEYLGDYVNFLRNARVDEILPGLLNIIESDIKYHIGIDNILDSFQESISEAIEYYETKNSLYIVKFFFKLSLYYFFKGQHSIAIFNTLQCLAYCHKLRDAMGFKKSVALFETFREYANGEQLMQYIEIMKAIIEEEFKHEKSLLCAGDHNRVN